MDFSGIIRWYIKWWWAVGIAWFISFFILFVVQIGKFITISKDAFNIIYFPLYINSLFWDGLDGVGAVGYLTLFIFFLIPCYFLAIIFKLLLKGGNK